MNKTLIAFYSFSGNTRVIAENISAQLSGRLMEIVPEKPYTFDYNTAAKEVRTEITRGFCPALVSGGIPIDAYDIIFIGTPNWFKSFAPPVLSFIRGHDFSGKTVVPFCTHGGGGFGEIERRLSEECSGATLLKGLAATPDTSPKQIMAWLAAVGLDHP